MPTLFSESLLFLHTGHLLHCQHIDIAILFQNIPGDALTSVDISHVETGTLFAKDQEIQGDLEELSNLEGSEYSFQTSMEELEENQKDIQLTLQEPQNNDNKKQQHENTVSGRYNSSRCKTTMHRGTCRSARKLSVQRKVRIMRYLSYFSEQGAIRDTTTSSFISESKTENMDAKCHMAHLDTKGGTSALQSEVSTNAEELEQLCGKQVTAADIELERMKWDFVLAKLKYEHEDNEKQRLHEERMEQIHQQAVKRSWQAKKRGRGKGQWSRKEDLARRSSTVFSPGAAKLSRSNEPQRKAASARLDWQDRLVDLLIQLHSGA
ncbi:hypothetical protein QYF61_012210 [Mycteria americana]|uniref:Uncharacterized protein n=1 Tax=Mycteria americana TaxID=33587 RepID=A0AAN7SA60_MYCAM|nr:hypothetical protein QYF61_012210 [Mycteria americana]